MGLRTVKARLKTLSRRRDFEAPTERLDEVMAVLAASGAGTERVVEQVDYVYDVPRPSGAPELAKLRHERPYCWKLYLYNPAE